MVLGCDSLIFPPAALPTASSPLMAQSTKDNLEKQRKTNAKSAREQRQALQMTYQVRSLAFMVESRVGSVFLILMRGRLCFAVVECVMCMFGWGIGTLKTAVSNLDF